MATFSSSKLSSLYLHLSPVSTMQLGDDELVTEAFWSSSDPTMPEESSTLHWPESHCTNHNNAGAVNSPPIDVSSDAYRQSSEALIMAKEETNGSASAAEESVEKSPTPSLPPAPASRTKKRKLLAEKYGLAGGGGGQVEEAPPEKKGRIWKIEKRRESIHERLRILQRLFPNGTNVDASTLLDEAARYVQFLHLQIKLLSSDEQWMFAPISYNGTATASDLEISTLL